MYKIVHCHKDCSKCKHLSRRIDNYGYPLDYKCLKFNDSVFEDIFTCTKTFNILISISKSEAIENHRKLWNWIANRNKECIDAQTKPIDKKQYFTENAIPSSLRPEWNCYLCDYALYQAEGDADNRCKFCPIDWSNRGAFNVSECIDNNEDSIYGLFLESVTFEDTEECARLAKIIANLPERNEEDQIDD